MREIAPGLWHWKARHPRTGAQASSYYLAEQRVLIDPMTPPDGLDSMRRLGAPAHVVLSNRHHDRDAWSLREAFGCVVHCVANGVYELEGRGSAQPFDFGDELPGGIVAHEVDAICPDESALQIPALRALACADGLIQPRDAALGFVPDSLMDDPERTRRGLIDAYTRLLELDFDVLLLAHGDPLTHDGKEALREFLQSAG